MLISMVDSYTQTYGTDRWNIYKTFSLSQNQIDNILEIKWGISSYSDYLIYYNTWKKQWKTRLYNKLSTLKENLEREYSWSVDPIHYLIDLYYIEWQSINKIYLKLKDIWLNYEDCSWIEKIFKQVFEWDLRDASWSQLTSKIKSKNWQINKANAENKRINDEKYNTIREYFSNKIKDITSDTPDIAELLKKDKILFLLSYITWLDKCTLVTDLKNLRDKKNIWPIILANTLNDLFKLHLSEDVSITVYSKDIPYILK